MLVLLEAGDSLAHIIYLSDCLRQLCDQVLLSTMQPEQGFGGSVCQWVFFTRQQFIVQCLPLEA
ncbi:hypothetical protein CES87_30975 [Pseudomonas sp. ERMR1:02]|nr:hypothetical protein CES87_30975 [Pseudomonas sp. ERMR1:02]